MNESVLSNEEVDTSKYKGRKELLGSIQQQAAKAKERLLQKDVDKYDDSAHHNI